jgi:subtilisin family serine protease
MFSAIVMSGANVVQDSGITGAGTKIGIIDTGVDIDHPDFGGSGTNGTTSFPTAKIVAGWDFVGDDYAAGVGDPVPDPVPDDCNGHGTHVAGIAAANGYVKGVAPDAQLGAYRVFGCSGSTDADIMIAAMERAYNDGMNVVNMSIGSAFQSWPNYPTATAGDWLVARGVVVACSIGNSGTSGLYANGAPGVGKDVIGTANFLNTSVTLSTFTVSPDDTVIGYNTATGAPLPPTSGTEPMDRTGTSASTADGCPPWDPTFGPGGPPATGGTNTYYAGGAWLAPGSMTGKVVLIRRGTCGFWHKAYNAQQAGASGVVLYNNVAGRINPTVAPPTTLNNFPGDPTINIPVVSISDTEGVLIDSRLAGGPVDMTWTANYGTFANPAGGVIDPSSSYGLAADLSLKPDIGAPGGNIFSTYPLESGGYNTISGTSMASPHIAGSAALLLQAHPGAKIIP